MSIRILDSAGLILGVLTLAATVKLIDLEALKNLGAVRVEVAK
ncbi:hypothetical protein [Pseudomonas helleri]